MKKLIFAADGPEPEIVLRDALNDDPEIGEKAERRLVYDRGQALPACPGNRKERTSP